MPTHDKIFLETQEHNSMMMKNLIKDEMKKELLDISQYIQMLGTREGEENNPEHWSKLQSYISDKINKYS